MKRYRVIGILLVLLASGMATIAQAQITPGVIAGLSLYDESQSGNGTSGSSGSEVGGVVGGILEFGLTENVSLRTGLIYSVRGGSLGAFASPSPPAPAGVSFTETDYLGYLTIPIDLKISYAASPGVVPYGLIGFNLGILVSAIGGVENEDAASGNIDAGVGYNPLDFGLDVGLGSEFPGSDITPFVEIAGYIGFTNISSYLPSGSSLTNTGVEFRAGVRFKPEVISRIF